MKLLLQNIAKIKTGVFCQTSKTGNTIYLQATDLQFNGLINPHLKPNLYVEGKLQNRLLIRGDVIFIAKSVNNLALAYNPQIHPPLIASTAFLIISITQPDVLPEYLAWYLNQPSAQQYLKAQAKGSSPASITVNILGELEIDVPNLARQKVILKIHDLRMRQQQLKSDIEHLKLSILNYQLSKATRL